MPKAGDPRDKVVSSDFVRARRPCRLLLIGAAVLLVFFVGLAAWLFISGIAPESQEDDARAACQSAVEDELDAPRTQLVFNEESATMFGNNNWRVSGTVDTPGDPETPGTTEYTCVYGGGEIIDVQLTPSVR